jgi:hypothetical protein
MQFGTRNNLAFQLELDFLKFISFQYRTNKKPMLTKISLRPESSEAVVDIRIFSSSSLMDKSFSMKTPVTGIKG